MPPRVARVALLGASLLSLAVVALAWVASGSTAALALAALAAFACAAWWLIEPRSATDEAEEALSQLDAQIDAAAGTRLAMRMRAETAGRFREEFVAAVRHELNTPLNAILGFTEVLLQEVDGPLTAAQEEDVGAIRSAGLYLRELVEAVLAEWVPDREMPVPLERVSMHDMLSGVVRLLRGQLGERQVTLEFEVAPDTPSPLADPRRLRQVLINFGTNALRATSLGSVRFEAAPHPDGLCISVRDTGTGIAPEDIPELFTEFAQAGPEERRRGGTGLGLALSRDMIEWHGGRIEVESTLGEGTVFHVLLPTEAD
jgi:two-component system sensor histidine kinase/response regulator